MGVQGAAGLVCPWGSVSASRQAGGLEDGGDRDILEQEGLCSEVRRGTLDVPLVTAPFGAWLGGQRGGSGQLLAALNWIYSLPSLK